MDYYNNSRQVTISISTKPTVKKNQRSFLEYKQSFSTSQFRYFSLNILTSLFLHCTVPGELEI